MTAAIRPTLALLGALIVTVALAAAMADQAHAASQIVKLTQIRSVDGREFAMTVFKNPTTGKPSVAALIRSDSPSVTQQRWIKVDKGNGYATYENVKYAGQCLQVLTKTSGESLKLGSCQPGDSRQMWTQGFGSGTFRKLQNLESSRAATRNGTGVQQAFDTGLETQKWAIVGV